MSRFPELFEEAIDEVVIEEAFLVEDLRRPHRAPHPRAAPRALVVASYPVERTTPGHGRRALDRVSRCDPDLGAQRLLAFSTMCARCALRAPRPGRTRRHDLLDRLLEELREARHVHALLRGVEVHRALDIGGDLLLVVAVPDPDRLAHSRNARRARGRAAPRMRRTGHRLRANGESRPSSAQTVPRAFVAENRFLRAFVSLACHDLRTPLATVSGFAHTLRSRGARRACGPVRRHDPGASSQLRSSWTTRARRSSRGRPLRAAPHWDGYARARAGGRGLPVGDVAAPEPARPVDLDPVRPSALAALALRALRHGASSCVELRGRPSVYRARDSGERAGSCSARTSGTSAPPRRASTWKRSAARSLSRGMRAGRPAPTAGGATAGGP